MKISVLLPISNNTEKSYDAINSILNQTYKNYEILICLNGNSLSFEKKIKKYKKIKKLNFLRTKKKYYFALNLLIENSKGEYCAELMR